MPGAHSVQCKPGNTQPMGEDMKEKNEVQKRMQLPDAVYKLLGDQGIQKEDILYKAEPDLDSELRFARNYLVMTKEVLVLISYPYQAHGKFRFGGYAGNELADGLPTEPEIKKLSLNEVEKLEIIRAVNGGSLMAVVNGEEIFLCAFSNSRMGEVERAKRNLEKIKKHKRVMSLQHAFVKYFTKEIIMNIALIAHDKKKNKMIDLAIKYKDVLKKHNLFATGTTGTLIMGETGLNINRMKSGPLGGDQQIGAMIAANEIDLVVFLRDPLTAQPHEPDVSALLRLCDVQNIPLATNVHSAEIMLEHIG